MRPPGPAWHVREGAFLGAARGSPKKKQKSFGLKRRKLIPMLSWCFSLFSAVTFRFQWCSGVLKSEVPSSHQKIHVRCNDVSSWYQTRPALSPSLAFMSSDFGLWLVLKRSWPGDSTSFLNTQEEPYQTSKLSSLVYPQYLRKQPHWRSESHILPFKKLDQATWTKREPSSPAVKCSIEPPKKNLCPIPVYILAGK